jgi:DNA-binding transcriptional ArsR family regulator
MSDAPDSTNFDKSRAELFDALSHPVRINILHALEDGPLSFSELRRKVGLESSGHLQFHLAKLDGLVVTSADGTYVLTDDGREALRVVGDRAVSIGQGSGRRNSEGKMLVSRWLLVGAVALVIFVASITGLVYVQLGGYASSLQSEVSSLHDQLYHYLYPVTVCQENGTAACSSALASIVSQDSRILSLENGTSYTYYMSLLTGSQNTNGSIFSLDLIFVANRSDLANTSTIWAKVPITGSNTSYLGDYDIVNTEFTYYTPNQIVSIRF